MRKSAWLLTTITVIPRLICHDQASIGDQCVDLIGDNLRKKSCCSGRAIGIAIPSQPQERANSLTRKVSKLPFPAVYKQTTRKSVVHRTIQSLVQRFQSTHFCRERISGRCSVSRRKTVCHRLLFYPAIETSKFLSFCYLRFNAFRSNKRSNPYGSALTRRF